MGIADHGEYTQVRWDVIVGYAKTVNLAIKPVGVVQDPAGHGKDFTDIDPFNKQELLDFIKWADIKFLRSEWIREIATSADQWIKDFVPEVGSAKPTLLEALVDHGRAKDSELQKMQQDLPAEAFASHEELSSVPSLRVLSYAWQSAAHPDPAGKIAAAIICSLCWHYFDFKKDALFWDHKSIPQKLMRPDFDPRKGHRYQDFLIRDRTPKEAEFFKRALRGMQSLYFSTHTTGIIIAEVPQDALNPMPYSQRGWPLMESTALGLSSCHKFGLDGQRKPLTAGLVLSIEDFNSELEKREFTGRGDRDLVRDFYRRGLNAYQERATSINIPLAPEAMETVARFLHGFKKLEKIDLIGKSGSDVDVSVCPQLLEVLSLHKARGCSVVRSPVTGVDLDSE